jgi:hypothetical protein
MQGEGCQCNVLAIFLFIDRSRITGFQIRACAVKNIGAGSIAI